MKIALITLGIHPYVMGGIQKHSFNLACHLARLGVEVDLYHTDFGDSRGIGGLDEFSKDEASMINSFPVPWPKGFRYPGHYIDETKRWSQKVHALLKDRPAVDCVYGQGITAWDIIQSNRFGGGSSPVIVNLHGYEMFQPSRVPRTMVSNIMMRRAFGRHARLADSVVSLGGKLTNLIETEVGVPRHRIVELPVGIDSKWILPEIRPTPDRLRFVFLGRFERRKGIQELHKVIARNPGWRERATFSFIGPIPQEHQLNLPYVVYHGPVFDARKLMDELRQSDVLLCPSHSEGMPTVILEAMACGLAVIATDVGAVGVLVGEHNGILLDRCSHRGIKEAIEAMIQAPSAHLDRLKGQSLQHVRNFTWNEVASRTLRAIEHCVAGRQIK
jgi:glycosyltransferase involved in cell wall biosynthesis